jgi:hypothetical protein
VTSTCANSTRFMSDLQSSMLAEYFLEIFGWTGMLMSFLVDKLIDVFCKRQKPEIANSI